MEFITPPLFFTLSLPPSLSLSTLPPPLSLPHVLPCDTVPPGGGGLINQKEAYFTPHLSPETEM